MDYLKNLHLDSVSPATDKIMDGIILLTNSLQTTDQLRSDMYKNVLPSEWKGLMSKPKGPHDELFGDIEARVKDFQTQQNILQSFQEAKDKEASSKAHKPKMSVKLPKPSSHYYCRS